MQYANAEEGKAASAGNGDAADTTGESNEEGEAESEVQEDASATGEGAVGDNTAAPDGGAIISDGSDAADDVSQEEEDNAAQAGTVLDSNMGRMPGKVEMIILIATIILIPLITLFLKKRIETGSKKKTK